MVFHYSLNGLLADEGTEYFKFCFDLLDQHGGPDHDEQSLDCLQSAYAHVMGRVAELRAEGLVREVFLKADRTGPILLLNDIGAAEARDRLASLPFVEHELVTFDYIELNDASPA